MNNAGFYIFALIAVVVAALIMRHVVTCLMRAIVIALLLVVLAGAYYLFIGQYDPETYEMINNSLEGK
jgi:hypothetical protein